jgi:Domain of unknown function (DUF3854)/Protein of unknown function (DUF3987)
VTKAPNNSHLYPQHRAELLESGLTQATIDDAGLYTESDPAVIARLLGWSGSASSLGPCLAFQFRDHKGNVNGYTRFKPDCPRLKDGKPVKYESPAGKPNRVYFPPGVIPILQDVSVALLLTEGEKKSLAATQAGYPCLGLVGVDGWNKPGTKQLNADLDVIAWDGRQVYIAYDSDAARNPNVRRAETELADALQNRAAKVCIVRLPEDVLGGEPVKNGLDDFLAKYGADRLRKLLDTSGLDVTPQLNSNPWPAALAEQAFHGPAGKLVRLIEPNSEADPAALLIQLLIGIGSMVGRDPHFFAEGDRHGTNEFVVLVGDTSDGAKGTSWGRVKEALKEVDAPPPGSMTLNAFPWCDRIKTGLSSGEGFIWAVRDPIERVEKTSAKGEAPKFEKVLADPGVPDKRLLVQEEEFVSVLRQGERSGNTLSPYLRNAWDGKTLEQQVKSNQAKATDAHISIVGHITPDELVRVLTDTDIRNGFANRFLWFCVKRSKYLPQGGGVMKCAVRMAVIRQIADAVQWAKTPREFRRDTEAEAVWSAVYRGLCDVPPGLTGKLLARGRPHVMRLAMIYAMLDRSEKIKAEHLVAALALWQYNAASVRYVFGDLLGDPVADELLALLRLSETGMSRTEISNAFQRNQTSGRLAQALALLAKYGLAEVRKTSTKGRPEERWFAGSPS